MSMNGVGILFASSTLGHHVVTTFVTPLLLLALGALLLMKVIEAKRRPLLQRWIAGTLVSVAALGLAGMFIWVDAGNWAASDAVARDVKSLDLSQAQGAGLPDREWFAGASDGAQARRVMPDLYAIRAEQSRFGVSVTEDFIVDRGHMRRCSPETACEELLQRIVGRRLLERLLRQQSSRGEAGADVSTGDRPGLTQLDPASAGQDS